MRYIMLAFFPILSIFMQSIFFNSFRLGPAIPDLMLIFIIVFALHAQAKQGAVYGLLGGLVEDLYIGSFIGVNALSKAITAYIIGSFQTRLFKENLMVGVFGIVAGTLINSFLVIGLTSINGGAFTLEIDLAIGILCQVAYNVLLTIPIYIVYYHLLNTGFFRPLER
ncbi:MAG: rod shape-determining protein MreD [Syntrophomonadaceae bacterium]|jgi:rod shape-determining protein MreD